MNIYQVLYKYSEMPVSEVIVAEDKDIITILADRNDCEECEISIIRKTKINKEQLKLNSLFIGDFLRLMKK